MVFNPTQDSYRRVQELIKLYRYNPKSFDDKQTDELQELANLHDLKLNRDVSETGIRRLAGQFSSGFLEGFTTIPVGREPRTTYESILNSLGHLAGFAPGIVAAPMKLAAKGANKMGFKAFGKSADKVGNAFIKANDWSIPMIVGGRSTKLLNKGLEKSGAEAVGIFKKGAKTRSIIESGVHLGTASSVSAIWHGPDAMIDAGIHGSIFGGGFGGLGEMKILNNHFISKNPKINKVGEQRLKGVIGATMMGLPSYLRDEPIEAVIYETLLGGFFGYQSRPGVEKHGGKIIMDQMYNGKASESIFKPEKYPGWDTYSKEVQNYVYKSNVELAKSYLSRMSLERGYKKEDIEQDILNGARDYYNVDRNEMPTDKQLNDFWMHEARNYYNGKFDYEQYVENKSTTPPDTRLDSNDPVELGQSKITKSQEINDRYKNKKVIVIELDKNGNVSFAGSTGEDFGYKGKFQGKDVGERRVDRPEDYLTGQDHITFDSVIFKREGRINKNSPLDRVIDSKGRGQNVIGGKQRHQIDIELHKQNRYIVSGIKDKGVFVIKEYHPDVQRDGKGKYVVFDMHNLKDTIISSLSKNPDLSVDQQIKLAKELQKSYQESLDIAIENWAGGYGNKESITKMHEKQWISNVLSLAEANGLYSKGSRDLVNINQMSNEGFYKNVIDFNKRTQLLHDKSVPLPEGTLGRLDIAVFDDISFQEYTALDKNNKPIKKRFDSDTDGTLYLLPKDFDAVQKEMGLPENVSMNKPVIVARLQSGGYLLVKAASRKADPTIEKFMKANNLRGMLFKSAAKHTGNLKSNKLEYDPKTGEYFAPDGEIIRDYIKDTDIRINVGTYENPDKATKPQRIVRQLASVLNTKQARGAIDDIYNEMYKPSIEGNAVKNEAVDTYLKDSKGSPDMTNAINMHNEIVKLTQKLYRSTNKDSQKKIQKEINSKVDKLKNIVNVDDVGIEFIDKVFQRGGDDPLAQMFALQIARLENLGELENPDFFSASEWASYRRKSQRIQMIGQFNESVRDGMPFSMSENWNNTYKKYMLQRVIAPKWKYSGKSWLAPKPRHINIPEGTFMLDSGMKKMNIKLKDGTETTLGKAWNAYVKGGKKGDTSHFDFLIIRTPADSISGTRLLKFGGFTKDKGVSILTSAKDNMYLGGADKDSDSAHLYQGLSEKVKNHYKKNQTEWETSEGHAKEVKSSKWDKTFGADEVKDAPFKTFGSIFSPSMRKLTARTARNGQQGLGYGVVSKNALIAWADVINGSSNKTYVTKDAKGNEYRVSLQKGGYDRLLELGREIVNRSADSSNYPNMVNYENFPGILLRNAFKVEMKFKGKNYFTDITKNPDTYNKLAKFTDLGTINKMFRHLDPNKTQVKWNAMKNQFAKYSMHIDKFDTLHGKAAQELIRSGVLENRRDIQTILTIQDAVTAYKKIIELGSNPKTPEGKLISSINNLVSHKLPTARNLDKYLKEAEKTGNWNSVLANLRRDLFSISSHAAITRKGYEIYNAFKESGFTWKGKEVSPELIIKYLRNIADEATIIKLKLDNYKLNTQEGQLEKYSLEWYDTEIKEFKDLHLSKIVARLNKNENNKVTTEMLHDYFDVWLLSPFHRNTGAKDTYTKDWRGEDIFVGEFEPKKETYHPVGKRGQFGRKMVDPDAPEKGMYTDAPFVIERQIAFQSQQISNRAIEFILNEHKNIYNQFSEKPLKEVELKKIYEEIKIPNKPTEAEMPDQIRKYILEKIKIDEFYMSEAELDRRALTREDIKQVKIFNNYLKENPFIKDNFNDFFENFTLDHEGIRRDVTTMTMADTFHLNNYFKEMDLRFKKDGEKLPSNAWRTDPRYMDEKMWKAEQTFFTQFEGPVLTKDKYGKNKIVVRTVKRFTGTIGKIRDNMRAINRFIESRTQNLDIENDTIYPYRKNLDKQEADIVNKLVLAKREGADITKTKDYNKLKNKIFKIDNKEMTLDSLINDIDAAYTKDFTDFGTKWIYATDKGGKRINWKDIDQLAEYKQYNDYLKWDKDGKFDVEFFLNKTLKKIQKGKDVPEIPVEVLLRVQYERFVEAAVERARENPATAFISRKELREKYRNGETLLQGDQGTKSIHGMKFKAIGFRDPKKGYVPHLNFGRNKGAEKAQREWIMERAQDAYNKEFSISSDAKKAQREYDMVLLKYMHIAESSTQVDGGIARQAVESVMLDLEKMDLSDIKNLGMNHRPSSALERKTDMPGWDNSTGMIDIYKDQWIRASHKNLAAIFANHHVDSFIKKAPFGKYTKDWSLYLRSYFRDSMGHPTIFGNYLKDYMKADPKFKRRMYYWTSDQAVINGMNWISSRFGKYSSKIPFVCKNLKNVPKQPEFARDKDPALYDAMVNARMEYLTRLIHKFGSMEAKYNVISLLAHPKLSFGNLFGGSSLTITSVGLKNFRNAQKFQVIDKQLLRDKDGNYALNLKNGNPVTNKQELTQWMSEKGIIDSFIQGEFDINTNLRDLSSSSLRDLKSFKRELITLMKNNPNVKDETVLQLAKRYKVDKILVQSGAWFMQSSERKLRRDAFVGHALQYIDRWGRHGSELSLKDPAVIEAGLKGVEATQFLYHSAFRPAYMRTALGKVLTRFKLFVFQSVRTRKEFYRQAKHYGFEKGTAPYEKFKTDFQLNLFVTALAALLPYSLFDTALPPPYDWAQETSEWLFGNKRERDRAFFGQWPYPIAPLNVITPPVARIPMEAFSSLINNDWERFADYHVYTMFPFGRMVRSADKIIDEPYGTPFGRFSQQVMGIPTDKIKSRIDRQRLLNKRRRIIESELDILSEQEGAI